MAYNIGMRARGRPRVAGAMQDMDMNSIDVCSAAGIPRDRRGLACALLPCAIALALTACGGGGGNVRPSTPAPPTTPGGIGFTPTVPNDASIVVNPPAIPTQAPPASWAAPSINRHLSLTNAGGALGAGLTGQGITIGFVDSGVNRNHPTLAGRVTRHFIHVSSPPNNTSVDDVVGHGTTVASLAAGKPATGVYSAGGSDLWGGGIAQSATVVSSRIIADARPPDDGSGEGNEIHAGEGYGDFFRAINAELADAGARVINNSWGGLYWNDPALTLELANAWKDFVVNRGGIVVFANGNSGRDSRFRAEPSDNARLPSLANDPALEKGWLTVAALDPANPTQLTDYSQECGSAMNYCLAAPGNVVFIDPDATSQATSVLYQGGGTSYAAPLVSGAAAVVWSAFPYFSNDQVRQAILGGARDLGAAGVDSVFGWGLLDVSKAANGPSNFAWGDFSVSFAGNSVWRNPIIGSGGLIKGGSGILTLAEQAAYTGDTRVLAGGLSLRNGLGAPNNPRTRLDIAQGATVWARGGIYSNITNDGNFYSELAGIFGDYTQSATGNLGIWLSSTVTSISGKATIDGQLTVLGTWNGYQASGKQLLFNAMGGVSGTFSRLRAAPNVFLDASLSYNSNAVYLDINRINVANAVAGMSLSTITNVSAQRVESAMAAIDGQLGGIAPPTIGSAFIDAAGALQQSSSIANADLSLRSLSGELHAASTAMTFDAIDAGRRALNGRIDALSHSRGAAGGWYRDLSGSGTLAQSGFDSVGIDAAGEMIGNDVRIGDAVLGIAMNKLEQSSWLSEFGDRSRGRQRELQVYAAGWRGDWYGQAQLASGGFQRQMQRNLLLGAMQDSVATRLSGDYLGAFGELGRRFDAGGIALTPYLGTQYVRIANDGFDEAGASGFGLRANAWDSSRWQGFAGLRAARGWRVGDVDLRADARAEWQQTLASNGELFDASFVGIEQWAPLQGIGLARRSQVFGLGLSAAFTRNATFRFDLSRRSSDVGDSNMASLQAMYRF